MHQITLIGETRRVPDALVHQFKGAVEFTFKPLETALQSRPDGLMIIDVRLEERDRLKKIKEWILKKSEHAKILFVVDRFSHAQKIQINAIGGTGYLTRPIGRSALLQQLRDHDVPNPLKSVFSASEVPEGVAVIAGGMQSMFASACLGQPIDSKAIKAAGDMVASEIKTQGLADWIATVRTHHSQTYQHCLLVMGFAAAFGQNLGLANRDVQRLSFAAMVHDIGKARIPLSVLDKPGALNSNEIDLMKKHPEYGFDMLHSGSILPSEMLDMVVHHHEYLDGSGYPHKLHGSEISDLVRVITICDVFAALLERRAYKPPLSGMAAYQVLLDMGSKLDRSLVKAFEFTSRRSDKANPALS